MTKKKKTRLGLKQILHDHILNYHIKNINVDHVTFGNAKNVDHIGHVCMDMLIRYKKLEE